MRYGDKNMREALYEVLNETPGGGGDYDAEIAALQEGLAAETLARTETDNQLDSKIDSQINSIESLESDLNAEIGARTEKDSELDSSITTLESDLTNETNARIDADAQLSSDISGETTARETADDALSDRVTALESRPSEFRTYDFTVELTNFLLPSILNTNVTYSDTYGRIDISLPAELENTWMIMGMEKWECFDTANERVEAIPCFAFSMNGQKTLRTGFRTCRGYGGSDVAVARIRGAVLLARR